MNKAKIEACEKLCREFLDRAKAVKAEIKNVIFMFTILRISRSKMMKILKML